MTPDLPEKLLGISLDEPDRREPAGTEETEEVDFERFVFFTIGDHRLAVPVDDVRTITDPPETMTRVPRSPPAIEGVTDIRGEITAIVDSRVHFPTDDDPPEDAQLLVFDRPGDRQQAAMHIDDILGVEEVPEPDVLDRDAVESSELSGDALEHPLVVALVKQERVEQSGTGFEAASQSEDRPTETAVAPGGIASEAGRAADEDPFDGVDPTSSGGSARRRTTVPDVRSRTIVEATAVVGVERLLLASGRTQSDRR